MDDIVTDHLSFSRIRQFLMCGLAYFFRYVAKLKPAFTPAALAFGSAFHRAAEEALVAKMTGVSPSVDELVVVFGQSLDESEAIAPIRWGEKDDRASAIDQARRMLVAWLTWERPPGRILAIEQSFEVEVAPWLPKL
ncbi:MAG: PD-(D/E)XK nuclease family protein, partial [Candidatus Riflebacteria bacterium]|nr:PD-(D/E)XK nuclease family protein [Candidatus Riflebacteria bacterium]